MDLIADALLLAGAVAAAIYCWVLSKRVRGLSDLDGGLGSAIASLSLQVEEMQTALKATQSVTGSTVSELEALVDRADVATSQLKLVLATVHENRAQNPGKEQRRARLKRAIEEEEIPAENPEIQAQAEPSKAPAKAQAEPPKAPVKAQAKAANPPAPAQKARTPRRVIRETAQEEPAPAAAEHQEPPAPRNAPLRAKLRPKAPANHDAHEDSGQDPNAPLSFPDPQSRRAMSAKTSRLKENVTERLQSRDVPMDEEDAIPRSHTELVEALQTILAGQR